jgi:outer membrane biosynthesis protein TonB
MNRPILVFSMLVAAAATLAAQDPQQAQQQQPNPYAGTSAPPSDSTIQDSQPPAPTPQPKPSPAQYPQQSAPAQPPQAAPAQVPLPANSYAPANGTDSGTVQIAPDNSQPTLNQRAPMDDPDGDIVHPAPPPPGTLGYGTTIRVRLLDRLSTTESREGEPFHTRVSSDVYQNDQVLIPAGSEIDGRIVHVSTGHLGGHGSMVLHPETVILPNGAQFKMYAQLSGTPGSNTRVGDEGALTPGSRIKRDSIEYGGATGAGVVAGAVVGGPAGALAGGLIGAGAVTVHLLINHPQAKLDEGSTLVFTLTEPLDLVSALQPQPAMQMQPQAQPQAQPPAPAQGQDQSSDQPAQAPDQQQPTQN